MSKKGWIAAVVIVAGLAGGALILHGPAARHRSPTAAAPEVTVAQVIVRPIRPTREFSGHIRAVNTVNVRPRVDGYIESVNFDAGERVEKGDLLFQIDPRLYQADVDRLNARLEQAEANLEVAKANAERARRLLPKGAISRKQAQRDKAAAKEAGAEVAAAKAALASAHLKLEFTEIRSPIDGRIGKARITPGNLVTSTNVLTTVVTMSPVYVEFNVDEHSYLQLAQAKSIDIGNASLPVSMALADENTWSHQGLVHFVGNNLLANTGTIELRATFQNPGGVLTPGAYARLKLPIGPREPTVLIDGRAVGTDLSSRYVYVVGNDGRAEYRQVTLGPLFHGLRIVRSGLAQGDVVLVSGLQHVRPGVKVDPTMVAMGRRLDDRQRAIVNATARPDAAVEIASRTTRQP